MQYLSKNNDLWLLSFHVLKMRVNPLNDLLGKNSSGYTCVYEIYLLTHDFLWFKKRMNVLSSNKKLQWLEIKCKLR